jgi:hypothetical protein
MVIPMDTEVMHRRVFPRQHPSLPLEERHRKEIVFEKLAILAALEK